MTDETTEVMELLLRVQRAIHRSKVLTGSQPPWIATPSLTMAQLRADALVIGPDLFFNSKLEQIAARALRQALPEIHTYREFAAVGGLASYGASETEFYRLVGIQVGKILNGAKPAELPVQQSTKIELTINLKTAKALGLTVPQSLLARADEVIE